ncbi:hypothetical protein Efla_004322 [Eimeria flavescens]
MTGLRVFVVAGASLLSLRAGGASGNTPSSEPSHKAARVDCLGAMNVARAKVGFPDFKAATTEGSKLPVVGAASNSHPSSRENPASGTSASPASAQNQAQQKEAHGTSRDLVGTEGTYMYAPELTDSGGDCQAAIEYWKDAILSFPPLPPVYSASERLYDIDQTVSFVGLFNPDDKPAVDCAFITCNPEATRDGEAGGNQSQRGVSTPSPPSSTEPNHSNAEPPPESDVDEADEDDLYERRLAAADEDGPTYSLFCLSSPPALRDFEAPFTQEQWDKIMGVANFSAQPSVFGALTIAMAAVGHLVI